MSSHNRNIHSEDEKPEKEKVNIYDNDEAYMLNDEKDLDLLDSGNRLEGDQLDHLENFDQAENFDNDEPNYEEELDAEREMHELDDDEGETVRNQEAEGSRSNQQHKDRSSGLITLKYISVCQFCKENFNSNSNVPFLLKCGHFFCRNCLINNFTGEDGQVYCPDDGPVANSLSDLKLLSNLIIDRTVDEETSNTNRVSGMCEQHPGQKLSHYVEDTREVICVYCAFNKFKKNPKYEIKEIKEKCAEILVVVDKNLNDNQHYVEVLQSTLKDIKENKITEEERVTNLYDEVIKYLEEKKNEMFENINNMFANNADKLSEKLDYFSSKMEDAEELKAHIVAVMNNSSFQINEVMQRYTQFIREASDSSKLNLELIEYKFSHDDENKMIKYLNNFGDLKSKTKHIRFMPKGHNEHFTSYNPQENVDLQFKNMNLLPNKKKYETNYSVNNNTKYNNLYQNDILNTSELHENEFSGGRVNTQGQANVKETNSNHSDYLSANNSKDFAKNYNNLLLRPKQTTTTSTYPNLNRNDLLAGTSSKYNYSRPTAEYTYEPKNRDFNFSRESASNFNKTPDTGKKLI